MSDQNYDPTYDRYATGQAYPPAGSFDRTVQHAPQRWGFIESVSDGLSKYVDFSGRATRAQYWWFALFANLAIVGAVILDVILGFGLLWAIVCLGLLLPGLAVSIRRLHDTNRSGWWYLLAFTPVSIVLLVFMLLPSEPSSRY